MFFRSERRVSYPQFVSSCQVLEKSFGNVQGKGQSRVTVDFDMAKEQQRQRGLDVSKIAEQGKKVTESKEISFAVSGDSLGERWTSVDGDGCG